MPDDRPRASDYDRWLAPHKTVLNIVCWIWTITAGGGGAWLLATRGPTQLTNGWFALVSGLAACPFTASVLSRQQHGGVTRRALLACAVLFFIAGKVALAVGW